LAGTIATHRVAPIRRPRKNNTTADFQISTRRGALARIFAPQ
jgi:hypothetical protein